ncbi:MAG TPA: hypothetical protein DEH78_10715 [Solibacterales bacterium]|nr:hypothetical protein [Bryobacterales bacterium]
MRATLVGSVIVPLLLGLPLQAGPAEDYTQRHQIKAFKQKAFDVAHDLHIHLSLPEKTDYKNKIKSVELIYAKGLPNPEKKTPPVNDDGSVDLTWKDLQIKNSDARFLVSYQMVLERKNELITKAHWTKKGTRINDKGEVEDYTEWAEIAVAAGWEVSDPVKSGDVWAHRITVFNAEESGGGSFYLPRLYYSVIEDPAPLAIETFDNYSFNNFFDVFLELDPGESVYFDVYSSRADARILGSFDIQEAEATEVLMNQTFDHSPTVPEPIYFVPLVFLLGGMLWRRSLKRRAGDRLRFP